MDKYLRVTMPDGSRWDVPALLIAQHRARSVVEVNTETNFDEEVKFALENEREILDWATNAMNWKDVEKDARMVNEDRKVDYQEGWINGDRGIIEK